MPGQELVFALENPIVVDGDPDWDLVYFERDGGGEVVYLDLVVVRIGVSLTGDWYVVFDWGDNVPDWNTSVGSYGADGGEDANEAVPMTELDGELRLSILGSASMWMSRVFRSGSMIE